MVKLKHYKLKTIDSLGAEAKPKYLRNYILCFLSCCLLLSAPDAYGASTATTPDAIEDDTMPSVVTSSPSLTTLCELISQGKKSHKAHDYTSAIATYKQALEKYNEHYTEKNVLLAIIYNKMGMSYFALNAYTQSYHYLYQAIMIRHTCLSIATGIHNEPIRKSISKIMGQNLHHLGSLYFSVGSHNEARLAFKAALTTEWQHDEKAISTRCQLVKVYRQVQQHKFAILPLPKELKEENYVNTVTIAGAEKKLNQVTIAMPQPKEPYVKSATIGGVEKKLNQINEKITHQITPPMTIATPPHNAFVLTSPTSDKVTFAQINMSFTPHFPPGSSPSSQPIPDMPKLEQKESSLPHHPIPIKKTPFSCVQCGKGSSTKTALNLHLSVHTAEKTFACPICHKKFSRKQNMVVHSHVHTGEKPFSCLICHKKFTQKQNMKTHVRLHEGEKPLPSFFYGEKISQKNYMKAYSKHTYPH